MLAVTSAGESELVPGVPPLALSVPGYEYQSWVGVLAPAATPADVQEELHEAVQDAANSLAVRQGLHELGLEPVDESAAWFGRHLQREWTRWRDFALAHRAEFPGLR